MTQDSKGGWTLGVVARLPWNNGDVYCWGGDVIVCFGERAINLGSDQDSEPLARLIAAAPALVEAVQNLMGLFDNPVYRRRLAGDTLYSDAIAHARAALEAAGVKP